MRPAGYFLEGLLDLPQIADAPSRRAAWRQSIVSLSRSIEQEGPGPLEGIHPSALVPGVRVALEAGLVDELGWLSPDAAAVALYEIAAALPAGQEKRDVGRRVAAHTYEGNAATFAAVATRMAYGSGKGLAGGPVRARVALALELPAHVGTRIDGLALALASRRELSREWVAKPSMGALASRRLAARLLERAASEATARAAQGDDHALRAFRSEAVASAWKRLLADRESLVWRHVAVARGLLAGASDRLAEEIERDLSPSLTPTEWRRAATSLAASLGSDPDRVAARIRELVASEVVRRDYGVATSLFAGLARAAKEEPEAAEELVAFVVARQQGAAAEALEEAIRDEPGWRGTRAAEEARRELRLQAALMDRHADDGAHALATELARDLDAAPRADRPARVALGEALARFATTGAKAAYEAAQEALLVAREELSTLELSSPDLSTVERRSTFGTLRDLDVALLESAVLANLLSLDRRPADLSLSPLAVDELHDRLCELLLGWEVEPLRAGAKLAHPTTRLRRLRALLHLLDADVAEDDEQGGRSAAVRARWLRATHVLVERLVRDPRSVLERTICAGLARALDGLVRSEACDVVDATLFVAFRLRERRHFEILAEASMQPHFVAALSRYGAFLAAADEAPPSAEPARGSWPPASMPPLDGLKRRLDAFAAFAEESSEDGSSREEALRTVLVRLSRALEAAYAARSLGELGSGGVGDASALALLQSSTAALAQLVAAARHRLADPGDEAAPRSMLPPASSVDLAAAFERGASGDLDALADAIGAFVRSCDAALPKGVVELVRETLAHAASLPPRPSLVVASLPVAETQLPAWMPARRTLGGFYVLRSIGAGAVGSVFVAKRIEERNDPTAERFALKVPEYDAAVARHLSETEFLELFRAEASALLSLPAHANLARFVTFDLASRPKPILVMELVEGLTLERFVGTGRATTERVLALLDGVLAGLEAMHRAGLGHLDLKPSNVILRGGNEPVLVDFGLAGRHIRPGCGTGGYGAPEIWGVVPDGFTPQPMPADVYAFSCLAYEALTGRPLFDADGEIALVSAHVQHDGWPPPLRRWYDARTLAPLAQLLAAGLRRDPRARIGASAMREGLAKVAMTIAGAAWPFSA